MTRRFCHAPGLSEDRSADAVLVSPDETEWFVMREHSLFVWQLLEAPAPLEAVVAACMDEYDGDADAIYADVEATILAWVASGLVVEAS